MKEAGCFASKYHRPGTSPSYHSLRPGNDLVQSGSQERMKYQFGEVGLWEDCLKVSIKLADYVKSGRESHSTSMGPTSTSL